MEAQMLQAAGQALVTILDPFRMLLLVIGVVLGLIIGVVPGIGGLVGLVLLIPFTYALDPYAAFALLIAMAAVTHTADTIPAILFGVPGSVGSAATVLDGYALAKQGEAGRALGAGYMASLIGGLFGAVLLGVSIPLLRPVMLYLGSPELFSFCVFGLSMVAVLSGGQPLRGLAIAGIGLVIAMIGSSPQTGTMRFTFGTLYLFDGLPLVPLTLGLFAIPELAELAVNRSRIAAQSSDTKLSFRSQWDGCVDVLRRLWLVLRCSWIGAALGAVPGIGSAIIDWVAYGHAVQTEKNSQSFGKGDIRGVIASESANNAKEGGALVPTIAFGVPGSSSMAILLTAFLVHGLQPGPEMLTTHLDVTYSIIWSLAIANIFAAGLCIAFSGQWAKLALVRHSILVPLVLAICFIGAYQGSSNWGDLYVLLGFGAVGYIMKRYGWARPPLVLGIVIGDIFERYLFISVGRYGAEFLWQPVVLLMLGLSLWGIYRPLARTLGPTITHLGALRLSGAQFNLRTLFAAAVVVVAAYVLWISWRWPFDARIVPQVAAIAAVIFGGLNLLTEIFGAAGKGRLETALAGSAPMDLAATTGHEADARESGLTPALASRRALVYFAWIAGFLVVTWLIGLLPAIGVWIALYMRIEGRESARLIALTSGIMTLACWAVFDWLLRLAWPRSLLGDAWPWLRDLTGFI